MQLTPQAAALAALSGDALWRTRKHEQTPDPRWGEAQDRQALPVPAYAVALHVLIWDWDRVKFQGQFDYLGEPRAVPALPSQCLRQSLCLQVLAGACPAPGSQPLDP